VERSFDGQYGAKSHGFARDFGRGRQHRQPQREDGFLGVPANGLSADPHG
jgi:hypothetical protein